MKDTETIDQLFLELSQFTRATTAKELALQKKVDELERRVRELDPYGRGVVKTSEEF